MKGHLLRTTHEMVANSHLYVQTATDAISSVAILVFTFFLMVFVASCNIQHPVTLYNIPISPSHHQQIAIFIAAILLLGATGVYSQLDGLWPPSTWIYYGLCNLLFTAFIVVYHNRKQYSLIVSAVLIVLVAVDAEFLAMNAILADKHSYGLINLAGAVSGWALIWAFYVIGQVVVYKCEIQKKWQNFLFFVGAALLIVFRVVGLKPYGRIIMLHEVGFMLTSIPLTVLMFMRQKDYMIV